MAASTTVEANNTGSGANQPRMITNSTLPTFDISGYAIHLTSRSTTGCTEPSRPRIVL